MKRRLLLSLIILSVAQLVCAKEKLPVVVFLHGANVSEQESRGWASEMYKRLYQVGARIHFYPISWESNIGPSYNYHENCSNAFETAKKLAPIILNCRSVEFALRKLIYCFICVTFCAYGYNPFKDGALASVQVCVVDDCSQVVSNAFVSLMFSRSFEKVDVVKGLTNSNGCFVTNHLCTGELRLWVRAKNYYDTEEKTEAFRTLAILDVTNSKRWSQDCVPIYITLKRKRNPIHLLHHAWGYKMFPVTNQVLFLDLEILDWCPPYGKGIHQDMSLVFDGYRNPNDWFDFYENLKVSFPNCLDGLVLMKIDASSDFKYSYHADEKDI